MSFLLRAVAALALVLSLFSPAFAGTVTLTPGQNSITLDTPPPGATSVRIRMVSLSADLVHGYENLDSGASPSFTSNAQWGFTVKDGSTEIVTDRIFATAQSVSLGYDGALDWSGAGGQLYLETKTKGLQSWTTYNALPATLTTQTRTVTQPSEVAHYRLCDRTVTYEWEWL